MEEDNIIQNLELISHVLETGEDSFLENSTLGKIYVNAGNIGKSGYGLRHIIEQRLKKDKKDIEQTTALLPLILQAAHKGNIVKEVTKVINEIEVGTLNLEYNGIIAFVSKARGFLDEKFIITGYEDKNKKREATVAIQSVIEQYSYASEFSNVKKQVGAVASSLNIVNSTPNVKKNPINTKTKLQEKNSKKTLAPKKNCSTIQKEQKEKAMATKQKRKTTKRKLSPAQNLAAKKAAQKKKTSTRKNPVKKKTPAKKTAARKPATRRTPARRTPVKKAASRKPTTRKNPFVAGATYTDVPEPPKFNKSKAIYVGRLPHLEYITEAGTNSPRPFKYKHEFEGELPYLVSDGNNLFIVKGNKKMHFDPKRGIVG